MIKQSDVTKQCTKCKNTFEITLFCIDKTARGGRHPWCRSCRSKKRMEWFRSHKDMHHKSYNEWYARNQPEQRQRIRLWHKENREWMRNYIKEWKILNPDKVREYHAIRDERLVGDLTLDDWREIKEKYNYTCLSCKRIEPEILLTIDHVIPVVEGGLHTKANIQPLCRSCNSIKWRKTIDYRKENYGQAI